MKIQKFACALFSLAFLFSCSNDGSNENLPSGEFPLSLQKISNRIGVEEAYRNYVEGAIAFLDEQSPSKSRSSRAVNSVSALLFGDVKASAMKSGKYKDLGISDTLAYIFNFGDSSGFVIVSNDKRVKTPLFAFTEKGTLLDGKTDNPGLALFLERLEGYVLNSIAGSGKDDEKKEAIAVAQRGPLNPFGFRIVADRSVPVTWGQGKPFNNNLRYDNCYGQGTANNGRVWAGCVATAIAQIMSYWKYPSTLGNGSNYNWTILNNYKDTNDFKQSTSEAATARSQVADLFQKIGIGVDMDYDDCYGSGIYDEDDAIDFMIKPSVGFRFYGNPNNAKFRNYDNIFAQMALQDYGPLLVVGDEYQYDAAHAWVIDGMVYIYVPILPNPYKNYYVHNNWGWNGNQDGYYLEGVYDPEVSPGVYYDFKNIKVSLVYR
jgi:hypothetical protein